MTLTVCEMSGAEAANRWDGYVEAEPLATGYHLTGWKHVIEKAFGHPTFYYMVRDENGQVQGILPLVYLKSRCFGKFLVSLPYVNYGGLVASSPEAASLLLNAAVKRAEALEAKHIELRHGEGLCLTWPKKDHKVSMRLELTPRYEDLVKSFSAKLRSQVRRAEKEGMKLRLGGAALLEGFYEVFARNMRDLGTPVYGKRFFAEILSAFPNTASLILVEYNGQAVAAGLVYGYRGMLEVPWAASDRRFGRFAPNMMLYGAMLRYACEQGYRVFDFGRSSKNSGTYRFKEQWGATPVQLQWHYWLADGGPLPELNPQNPRYHLAIQAWKRLPLSWASQLGPAISKYLP